MYVCVCVCVSVCVCLTCTFVQRVYEKFPIIVRFSRFGHVSFDHFFLQQLNHVVDIAGTAERESERERETERDRERKREREREMGK